MVSQAIKQHGPEAVQLMIADKYMDAFKGLAKEGNTVLLPSNLNDPASMIATALNVYKTTSSKEISASKKIIAPALTTNA